MSRRRDFELWREVTATTVGLTGIVELYAKRVRREDHLALAGEMIEHADHLAERAERQRGRGKLRGAGPGVAGCQMQLIVGPSRQVRARNRSGWR
jgi:hypothetical protein